MSPQARKGVAAALVTSEVGYMAVTASAETGRQRAGGLQPGRRQRRWTMAASWVVAGRAGGLAAAAASVELPKCAAAAG